MKKTVQCIRIGTRSVEEMKWIQILITGRRITTHTLMKKEGEVKEGWETWEKGKNGLAEEE